MISTKYVRANSYESCKSQDSFVSKRTSRTGSIPSITDAFENADESSPLINDEEKTGSTKLVKNKKELIVLLSMGMIFFVGQTAVSVIAPFFTLEGKKKNVDVTVTGLIFAVYPFVMFILSPLVGKWMPLIGVKFTLIAGCFIEGVTEILFGFVGDMNDYTLFVSFCFVIRSFTAIGTAASSTAAIAILTITFPENISTVFGFLELFSGVGFMVGPTLGGILYSVGGFKLPFLVTGGLALVVLFAVYWVLPSEEAYKDTTRLGNKTETGSLIQTFLVPGVFMCSMVAIFGSMVLSFLDPTLTLHLEDITNNGLSSEQIGLVFLLPSVFYALSAPVIGYFADKKFKGRHAIIFGSFLVGVGYLFMGPSPFLTSVIPTKLYVVLIAIGSLGFGISPFLVPCLSNMHTAANYAGLPDNMATKSIISGIFNSCFSIGSVIGPTLGGFLTQHFSFAWASTIFGITLMVVGLFAMIFTIWESNSKWGRPHVEEEPTINV